MRVIFVNGARVDLTWREMHRLFWQPRFITLVLSLSLLVVLLRPYDNLADLGPVRLTVFYANAVAAFLALMAGTVFLLHRYGLAIYTVVCLAISVSGATIYAMASAVLLGARFPQGEELWLVILFNLIVALMGEVILIAYLLPGMLRDLSRSAGQMAKDDSIAADPAAKAPTPAPPSPERAGVSILGAEFMLSEVMALSAEGHYVRVVTRGGRRRLLRGRISDAVAALPDWAGQRIHRSHWVSARASQAVDQDGRNTVIVLTDGTRLPIARNRVQGTKTWLQRSGTGAMDNGPHR